VATRLSRELMRKLADLRYEPTSKRVRAMAGGHTFVDSRNSAIVWEPKRIVASYAVPDQDIRADLVPAPYADAAMNPVRIGADGPPVLDPNTSFAVHTCEGQPLTLEHGNVVLAGAGFRPADAELSGYVVLDFAAFDEWREEDEPIVGHPRDPFSRIDIRRSSSRVEVAVEGVTIADTTSAYLLFETRIPPRFYIPREDVRMELLTPSPTRTTCAYKGHAAYWSVTVAGQVHSDLCWTYEQPLPGVTEITDLVAFFDERVDVLLDGERRPRPITPWSR
jgi:uncharacterized protein (DUF427 family)